MSADERESIRTAWETLWAAWTRWVERNAYCAENERDPEIEELSRKTQVAGNRFTAVLIHTATCMHAPLGDLVELVAAVDEYDRQWAA